MTNASWPIAATINTASPIPFENLRQGTAASSLLTISNSAMPSAEALDGAVLTVTGAVTASGSIGQYSAASFATAADSGTGTLSTFAPSSPSPLLTAPH